MSGGVSGRIGRGRVANSANSFALSMSARVRRMIGIPFLPVRIAQADDPAYLSTLGIDAVQRQIPDDTNRPNTGSRHSTVVHRRHSIVGKESSRRRKPQRDRKVRYLDASLGWIYII